MNDGLVIHGKTDDELSLYVQKKLKQSAVFAEAFLNRVTFNSLFEISCGLGTNLISFKQRGCVVNGSEYKFMLQNVLADVKDRVVEMDITKPAAISKKYDLVLCSEVLEHIDEEFMDTAIQNLKEMSRKYIAVTVPLIHPGYESCASHITWENKNGNEWSRKLTQDELWRNTDGTVSQGHITMATAKWWEERFEKQGLYRDKGTELLIMQDFERGGIAVFYNLFFLYFAAQTDHQKKRTRSSVEEIRLGMKRFIRKRFYQTRMLFLRHALAVKKLFASRNYICSLTLSHRDSKKITYQPGELFFVDLSVHNKSARTLITDPNNKNRVRIGVRFWGSEHITENLPYYLNGGNGLGLDEKTYATFQIKCPYTAGLYDCEVSLVEDGITWFCDANNYFGNVIRFPLQVE